MCRALYTGRRYEIAPDTVFINRCSSRLHTRVLSLCESSPDEPLTYRWLFWKGISRNTGRRLEQVKPRKRESQSKNVLLSWSLLWVTKLHPTGNPVRSHVEYISESFALHAAGCHSSSQSKKSKRGWKARYKRCVKQIHFANLSHVEIQRAVIY